MINWRPEKVFCGGKKEGEIEREAERERQREKE